MTERFSTSRDQGGQDSTPHRSIFRTQRDDSSTSFIHSPIARRQESQRSSNALPQRHSFASSDMSDSQMRRYSTARAPSRSREHKKEDEDELDKFERKDDEFKQRDRGEALIRRRMRERKREKLLKMQENESGLNHFSTFESAPNARQQNQPIEEGLHSPKSQRHPEQGPGNQVEHGDADQSLMRDEDEEDEVDQDETPFEDEDQEDDGDDLEYTLKDRQDALNFEHPFGLPIWKPALYKKSRSITRTADSALKCMPGQDPGKGVVPGNIFWLVCFGSWLAALCYVLSSLLRLVPRGGAMYSRVLYGLATYIVWPFGNYVEVECSHKSGSRHGPCHWNHIHEHDVKDDDSDNTLHPTNEAHESTLLLPGSSKPGYGTAHCEEDDIGDDVAPATEGERIASERGVYHYVYDDQGHDIGVSKRWMGILVYAIIYAFIIVPVLGTVSLICWFLVVPIPMARLLWVLLRNLAEQPLALHFRSPLQIDTTVMRVQGSENEDAQQEPIQYPLRAGQMAPRLKPKHRKKGTSKRRSVILLCNYRAVGRQYWKYTVGGVNILFINTLPIVFFTILLFFAVRPQLQKHGINKGILAWLAGDAVIFLLSLCSVLPLSYFIGMAVASISTQSSIGMGAVINATFGSIIELLLYSIALVQGRAGLVEGSLIGSILAGVLLLPGLSMCSGATRRKEQKFNAQSAGVTSTMLIMAIIGILTPTIFYQIYGTFELQCSGCPSDIKGPQESWKCHQCSYEHLSAVMDPFYQSHVKGLIYTCATVLIFAYCVGLWFSLRTHASQIWNNTQVTPSAANAIPEHLPPGMHRASVYKRMLPANYLQQLLPTHHRRDSTIDAQQARRGHETIQSPHTQQTGGSQNATERHSQAPRQQDVLSPHQQSPENYKHLTNQESSSVQAEPHGQPSKRQTAEDRFLDAAAKMYQYIFDQHKDQTQAVPSAQNEQQGSNEAGGHDAPSWSRLCALSVLLGCTVLYAVIAEILVDVVDVVVKGSGLPEKFIGVTIFALVPNTTEFMNAVSFAINGNIALSLEIGSAYVLQVCLIQIPVLVGFSAWYNATHSLGPGEKLEDHVFTLLFPRWDIIAIILSIFLLTYTYIEARSNYHRGSILVLSYIVFLSGFYFAPGHDPDAFDPENVSSSMRWIVS